MRARLFCKYRSAGLNADNLQLRRRLDMARKLFFEKCKQYSQNYPNLSNPEDKHPLN